jgi:hypothetical protein
MFLLWYAASAYWMLVVFALVFGVCYGAYVALLPTIVMDLYGPRSVSGIIGCLYTGCGIGTLLGPWLAGVAYDTAGSYRLAILAGAAFLLGRRGLRASSWSMAAKPKPSIAVSDARGVRSLHVGGEAIQSAMRLGEPYALALDYTRCMMAFLLFHPGAASGADGRPGRRFAGEILPPESRENESSCCGGGRACHLRGARALRAAAGRRAASRSRIGDGCRSARARVLRRSRDRCVRGRAPCAQAREQRSSTTARSSRCASQARWW